MIASGSPLRALIRASLWTLPLVGCQASVQGKVKAGSDARVEEADPFAGLDEAEAPEGPDPESARLSELDGQLQSSPVRLALLGARHDLQLRPHTSPSCSCMAFAVGRPTDSRFAWEDGAPVLSGTDSTVVAFGMVDGECAADVQASYRGYRVSGSDVHILLEVAVEGRPRLSGAIVPTPQLGGRYVILPPADAPFGKSRVADEARCTLQEPSLATGPSPRVDGSPGSGGESEGKSALGETRTSATEGDEDVPTSAEFDATPTDIPMNDGEWSLRDGFHLGVILGLEYPIGRVNIGNGLTPATISGLGGGFDLFIGGNQKPGMAVGVTIGGASSPDPTFDFNASQRPAAEMLADQSGWTLEGTSLVLSGTQLNLFRLGAFVDYYFSDESNWHGLLTLGYASMSFSGADVSDTLQGFAMQGGVGYDFWIGYHWSLGLLGRVMWSPMSAPSLEKVAHVFSPNLGITATFH